MSFDNENRKKKHVDICLKEDVAYHKKTGFERYEFIHNALPEIDFDEISTEVEFLGKRISFPLIISGMTGGAELSEKINRNLALAAQKKNIALGLGSQRIMMENKDLQKSFQVRRYAPSIPLLSNLGAVQLNNGFGLEECRKIVGIAGADALVLHLNPMQEVIQGGNTNFKGLGVRISELVGKAGFPILIKEVGFGISRKVSDRLSAMGVYAIDVSGSGGTSWSAVERFSNAEAGMDLGNVFWDWGISTAECLEMNKGIKPRLIAGGGIRTGLDMAKAIAMGASYCSIAGSFLKASVTSSDAVIKEIERLEMELRAAMFGIGARSIEELRCSDALVKLS